MQAKKSAQSANLKESESDFARTGSRYVNYERFNEQKRNSLLLRGLFNNPASSRLFSSHCWARFPVYSIKQSR